jgi:hypothetical protein
MGSSATKEQLREYIEVRFRAEKYVVTYFLAESEAIALRPTERGRRSKSAECGRGFKWRGPTQWGAGRLSRRRHPCFRRPTVRMNLGQPFDREIENRATATIGQLSWSRVRTRSWAGFSLSSYYRLRSTGFAIRGISSRTDRQTAGSKPATLRDPRTVRTLSVSEGLGSRRYLHRMPIAKPANIIKSTTAAAPANL